MEESRDDMLSEDDSDDNEIISRSRRNQRESRHRSSLRHHGSRRHGHGLRAQHNPAADINGRVTPDDGVQESRDLQEGEGSVRRSTRNRKQKYDNFNNTWIDGMNGPLRGYPSPFSGDKKKTCGDAGDQERRTTRAKRSVNYAAVYMSDDKDDDKEPSEEEGVEGQARSMKRARTIAQLDTTGGDLDNDADDLDMYSRVKRSRRPAKRFMFDDETQNNAPGRVVGGNQTETQSSQTSTDDESEDKVPKYCLRQRKPTVDRYQSSIDPPRPSRSSRVMRSMMRRRCNRRGRSSSSSSSEEEHLNTSRRSKAKAGHNKTLSSRCLPTPLNLVSAGDSKSKTSGATLADVDPMSLDRSIMFTNVGGLEEHIRCLKEMVVFPMLYPEVFEKYRIQPAKGVLFHGLPGTGKTLLARALANECSQGERKVAFFMRKGADCLTKWVGESERQLRLLFDQAYQMRPSIIFFDEMDGLAPVRSSKQDQIHSSIVSTLLALMDGLDSRGEVVIIGATNRIDAIDPALRRPGRFDRELYFPLPARQERAEILGIHVSKWDQPPSPHLLTTLAEQAAGYCGSDLRALCSEAVLNGLRRRYPQIYKSSQKLLLDPDAVKVEQEDFLRAKSTIVPAAHRCTPSAGRKLPQVVEPLLRDSLAQAVDILREAFPHGLTRTVASAELVNMSDKVHRPHLLVDGTSGGQGQSHVGPALLSLMEHVAVHTLDLATLYHSSSQTVEEACIQTFNEARRNVPSIVYVPCIGKLWELASETLRAVFLSKLSDLDPASPVLLLATSQDLHSQLPQEISSLFSQYRGQVLTLDYPNRAQRQAFFSPLLLADTCAPPRRPERVEEPEELPLAPPPPPPKLTEEQLKACYEQEETTLRELRIFLRDCCSKLARNRLFFMFTKPVDIGEVPDYLNIIQQPMDLETMMTKIDLHRYACAQEFLDDIDLVVRNALEYNPDRTGEDKLIRHRACCLRDTAYALIKAEMDTDYEDKCKKISVSRRQRSDSPSRFVPEFIQTKPKVATVTFSSSEQQVKDTPASSQVVDPDATLTPAAQVKRTPLANNGLVKRRWSATNYASVAKRRKMSSWSRGFLSSNKKKPRAIRPIIAANNVHVPVSHAPDIADKESDAEVKPTHLLNGNASASEAQLGGEVKTKSAVMSNGIAFERSGRQLRANSFPPSKSHLTRNKSVAMVFKSLDSSMNETECNDSIADTTAGSSTTPSKEQAVGSREQAVATSTETPHAAVCQPDCDPEASLVSTVVIDSSKLAALLDRAVAVTESCDVDLLLDLHAQLSKHVFRANKDWIRSTLVQSLSAELDRFEKLKSV